jgi:5-methylcytosine-specific restriction endonuclease McrA
MITKKCLICKSTIPNKVFQSYCSGACKAKAWRLRNPERVIEVRKKHYEKNREKILEKDKERYWNGGKEKANQQSKNWYNRNKNKRSKYTKEYREQNKKLFQKYKDIERFGGNKEKVLKRDKNKCRICSSVSKLQIHHIDGSGGNSIRGYENVNNDMYNLITLCSLCHRRVHGYEHRNMQRFKTIDDIVRTMAKVIEQYYAILPPRNRK